MQISNILSSLCIWADSFESYLVRNPDEAHIVYSYINMIYAYVSQKLIKY